MKLGSDKVGKRLLEARTALGLTMDQLAKKAGVDQTTISKVETGRNRPAAHTVERLALAMGIDPCWLTYGTGTKPEFKNKAEEEAANT